MDGTPVPVVFLRIPVARPASAVPLILVTVAVSDPVDPAAVTSPVIEIVWSPVLVPERFVPVTVPVAATDDGVMAPSVRLMAGVVVDVATVPLTPFAVVTETLVTDPTPAEAHDVVDPLVESTLPELPAWLGRRSFASGATHVASARRNFLAAVDPDVGAGTRPCVPPDPESPTMSGSMPLSVDMSKSLGAPVPLERPLTVGPVMSANFAFVTTPGWIVVVIDDVPDPATSDDSEIV